MPTYEYLCDSCGHQFDAFQSMMDDPLKDCPACSTPALRRLISGGTGVIFRGSGFYVNDSRSNGARSSSATSSADTSTSIPKDAANTSSGGDASASTASTSPASESSSVTSSGDSSGASSSKGSAPTKQSA